ncbi:MAG: choice-of-anchor J domain-containing protein [Oscillospiraceae bacterium]|nr:choice-of-anchor J domain-containing protein [Oscillospiraceae bacterium]
MKNTSLFRRVLSVVLVVAMVLSVMVPWASAEQTKTAGKNVKELTLTPTELGKQGSATKDVSGRDSEQDTGFAPLDVVRVSIVLEKPSTLDAGFSTEKIAQNAAALAYRESLRNDQKAMTAKIEKAIGGKLDVKWNLTLAANNISANVLYSQIETIKGIDGVKDVFLENRYEPQVGDKADEPNNGSASYMIGSNITWANGYTGAGSKVAVIDTGADIDHLSFSGEGLEYALQKNAEAKGLSYEDYLASLNLLTAESIEAVKGQLNANIGSGNAVYRNTKVGYGYNYVDKNTVNITHLTDSQGEHGSHVSGISTANRFVKVDGEFVPALQAVGTQGVAPDAQLVVMKVFGSGGGAYDSDYMVAIEDAIVLGCDSANLSLGSGSPGFSFSSGYESVMNKLVENGTVVAFSAGNSGMWYDTPNNMPYAYLYADDVNFATNGSPGSFTNALTVASVDNQGQTGLPLIFGDMHVFYSQTSGYGNAPVATLAGRDFDYVLLDGPGVDDNEHVGAAGDDFAALGSEIVSGKVALCYRGSSSFFAKANAAVAQGAVAVVIINNVDGIINMNLTGYNYTAPAVSILKADGDAIKANSEANTTEAGLTYYTGHMSIAEGLEVQIPEISDTVTVSSFSSYGMPGTLVLKPEILAPGGSIYSVWGANVGSSSPTQSHEDYEVMSGTSMASPQVAGMAAVMGQYIRDNDLCAKTGLSQRQLINSLLMSTAHPVFDEYGEYWSVFRVGAGLGNVADATSAKSYILMDEDATMFPDSARDGKVKAELGDDPDCTGEYSFSFTVYPLEDGKEFTLRTDIFTQAIAGMAPVGLLQDGSTMLLGSETTYEINGETVEDGFKVYADVDMDGDTDKDDAQAILDKITGKLAEDAPFDAKAADVDGDGEITSYDAKLLLESEATDAISVSAPTKVTVHIKIDDADIAELLNYFTNGFYVEGYTFVEPVPTAEGAMDVVHSIPVFGFCGNWTDPSMLDRSSAIDEAYGTGKVPYVNGNTNYLNLKSPEGETAIYMGNPYMIEDEFPVERLAMNSEATITAFNYLPIRNAATLAFAVQDENGKVLYAQATPTQKFSAYYHVNQGTWMNTSPSNYNVGKKLSQAGVQEGDVVTVGFYAIPEYYGVLYAKNNGGVAETGSLDTEAFSALLEEGLIGDGAAIKYTVKVDNQVPEVKGAFMDLITGDITVRASDDNYIAYVGVLNKSGTKEFMAVVPEQEGPGEEVEVPLDLEGQTLPSEVVLLVGDYAGNEAAFKVNLGGNGGGDDMGGTMIGFVTEQTTAAPGAGNRAWEIDAENLWYNHNTGAYEGLNNFANVEFAVTAAEYVDGYVFMAADDGYLYAAELGALDEASRVGSVAGLGYVYDMAFNYKTNNLYLLGEENSVYCVDLITGEAVKVAVVTLPGASTEMNRLACDDEGVFYTANNGSGSATKLYKFTLDNEPVNPDPIDPVDPIDPGESAYAWDFEDGTDGWTFVDVDGDGYNWQRHVNINDGNNHSAHSGDAVIYSESYSNDTGDALTPDNWAISPAFDLSEASGATLSIWAVGLDPSWCDEVFALYAGTSANPSDMIKIGGDYTATDEYTNYTADLSEFLGEEQVYVAIRHYNVSDMFILDVDDVEIVLADAGDAVSKAAVPVVHGEAVAKPHETRDGEDVIASYSFETEDELNAWTLDGGETNWIWSNNNLGGYDYSELAYDGSAFLMSYSFVDNQGACQADNWAISPAIAMPEEGSPSVTFAATNANASYPEPFSVYVGTSADPEAMELLEANISPATGYDAWSEYSFDLSDYVGETIYLAFYDYNYDGYEIWIDNVQFHGEGGGEVDPDPDPEPEPPEPVVEVQDVTAELIGNGLGVYNKSTGGSMAWDHNEGILYLASNWNATQDYDHYLWIVDTETGIAARANSVQGTGTSSSNPSARLYGSVRGLFIVPGGSHLIQPTDEPTGLEVEPGVLNIFKGQTAELKASVYPWTLKDKDVTFESADPAIASVNEDGVVTGVEVGETVITVATVAEPTLTVEIPVTVSVPPEAEIRGIIWDENGKGQASVFNTNAPEEWTALATVGQFRWGALVGDTVYGSTDDTMFAFDADTYEVTQFGGIVSMWIPSDADELPQDFRDAFAEMGYNVGPVIGPNNNGTYLTMLDPEAGSLIYFDLSDNVFGSDPLATFTYAGRDEYDDGESVDTNGALYYGATESGELYAFVMNHEGSIMWTDLGNIGIDLTGVADATNSVWASMVYDAATSFLFLSLYNGDDDYAHLYAIDTTDISRVGETGNFNAEVWPVTGLYEYEPATDLVLKVSPLDLVLFEGEEAELKIKVKLGETNEYTVEVADESVCTFADGVVTAVKEGETTITVTTVDTNEAGEHLSETVNVKVKGYRSVDASVVAQVTDENGVRFTKISLDGAVVSKTGVEAPGNVTSGGRAGDLYIADVGGGNLNILDALTYEPTLDWNEFDMSLYSSYPAMDFANFPMFKENDGSENNMKALMTVDINWLVMPSYSGWNLSSFISDLAAVAFVGAQQVEGSPIVYMYALLGADGTLYLMGIDVAAGRRTDPQPILNTGITLATQNDASMTYIATSKVNPDGSMDYAERGLVIADNGSKKLWYVDMMAETAEDALGLIGIMDVENVSGLVGTFDPLTDIFDMQQPVEPEDGPEDPGEYPEPAEGFYEELIGWDFEPDRQPEGWTFVDRDGDGNNWIWTPESDYAELPAHGGVGMIVSNSYINNVGPLNPDNFAISPAVDLSEVENANFAFYAKGQDPSYASEVFAVYAGTSPEVNEMVKISPDFTATGDWVQYTASLADYAGEEEVYVAIRHYNVTDQYILDVDDAAILVEGGEAPPEPEPSAPPIYEWSFENETDLDGWTLIDNDGDGNSWSRTSAVGYPTETIPETAYVLGSTYWNANALSDELAITPALDFSELTNATLSFWEKNGLSSFHENYAVYAGTSADFDEMVELVPVTAADSAWTNVIVDLADFCGEPEVYIAFRHTTDEVDRYRLYIDAIEITSVEEEEPTEPFEPIFWGFETDDDVAGWTMLNLDGSSEGFHRTTGYNSYEGNGYLVSSWGYPVDDWAITPELNLNGAAEPKFSFFMRDSGNSEEHVEVYVGDSPEDLDLVWSGIAPDTYEETVIDLSECVDWVSVYVAIRHCETDDGWNLFVDNVSVYDAAAEDGNACKQPAAAETYEYVPMKAAPAKALGDGYGRLSIAKVESSAEMMRVGETANAVSGGVNAIQGEIVKTRELLDNTTAAEGVYTIDLCETELSTNGLLEIVYDPEILSFEGALSNLELFSVNDDNGTIRFAYASSEDIAPETVLATLRFAAKVEKPLSEVVVTTLERGADLNVDEDELHIHICPGAIFSDMPEYGTPEHEAIDWAFVEGYTGGVGDGKFGVGMDMTRAQAVVFLWAVSGKPTVEGVENTFSDVADGVWYHDAVLWAVAEGITGGTGDGMFSPDMNVTRNQLMVFLWAMAGKPVPTSEENPYTDTEGTWWKDAAAWGYEIGIDRGAEGAFDGEGRCPREMFVLWLYRFVVEEARLTD